MSLDPEAEEYIEPIKKRETKKIKIHVKTLKKV